MITQTARTDTPTATLFDLEPGETLVAADNGPESRLCICIPTYKDSVDKLIGELSRIQGASHAALIVFDDGSGDRIMMAKAVDALKAYPGTYAYIAASENRGRSHVRNRLAAIAPSDWLLFLDADMLPDDGYFLTRYYDSIESSEGPELIVGGFSMRWVKRTRQTALHHAQSVKSDCLAAEVRARDPGRFVFTSNLLVHRDILNAVSFDEGYSGWGWEDVDWGLRVTEAYPVRHIENPASHLGLYSNRDLVQRFSSSGGNYSRLMRQHPEATARMPLTRAMHRLSGVAKIAPARSFARTIALDPTGLVPLPIRLLALKATRAMEYARHCDGGTDGRS